jgi:hypothetical protein
MSESAKAGATGASRTYGAIVWGQLRKRPSAMVSLGVIVLLALVAILAPFIAGEVPIRWVENGQVSWPIFRYLSNGEYAAMLGFALVLLAPLTVRLLRRRAAARPTGMAMTKIATSATRFRGMVMQARSQKRTGGLLLPPEVLYFMLSPKSPRSMWLIHRP